MVCAPLTNGSLAAHMGLLEKKWQQEEEAAEAVAKAAPGGWTEEATADAAAGPCSPIRIHEGLQYFADTGEKKRRACGETFRRAISSPKS